MAGVTDQPAYLALVALGIGEFAKLAGRRELSVSAAAAAALATAVGITGFVSVRDAVRLGGAPLPAGHTRIRPALRRACTEFPGPGVAASAQTLKERLAAAKR